VSSGYSLVFSGIAAAPSPPPLHSDLSGSIKWPVPYFPRRPTSSYFFFPDQTASNFSVFGSHPPNRPPELSSLIHLTEYRAPKAARTKPTELRAKRDHPQGRAHISWKTHRPLRRSPPLSFLPRRENDTSKEKSPSQFTCSPPTQQVFNGTTPIHTPFYSKDATNDKDTPPKIPSGNKMLSASLPSPS